MHDRKFPDWHGTTILAVRKGSKTVIAGDGQVAMGSTVVKGAARKVRRIADGRVLAGFAGATADAFTLLERLEAKLEQHPEQLARACVELSLGRAIALLSANPATILRVPGGTLTPGSPADVTLIDLNREWTVDVNTFASKSRNCPFEGWALQGKAVMTILGGKIMFGI